MGLNRQALAGILSRPFALIFRHFGQKTVNEYSSLRMTYTTYTKQRKNFAAGGLYQPAFDRGSCGFGLIANMDGQASHWLVQTAINSLTCLTHRGAIAADGKTGDGCGLLLKKPDSYLRRIAGEQGFDLLDRYAVGMVFLNRDQTLAEIARQRLEQELVGEGLAVAGWRPVPVDPAACGQQALDSLPEIEQIFINAGAGMEPDVFERHLYMARRKTEKAIEPQDDTFYISSISNHVISYKGLMMPDKLPVFYQDLLDEDLQSSLCVFHQRFSTNTLPEWRLSQPFRYLAHNGEINTIQGNRNWSIAREHKFETPLIPNIAEARPLVSMTGSDSSSLDNMVDALLMGGMDIFRAMSLLIPPAWQNVETMDADLRAYHEYNSMHMEPWDGPAGIVLTDGRYAACILDRNGLRPARYVITKDRHITLASEIGVYDYKPEDVVVKGRLKPGQMIAADTETGRLYLPQDIEDLLRKRLPCKQWLKQQTKYLKSSLADEEAYSISFDPGKLAVYEKLFQVTFEERDQILRVLAIIWRSKTCRKERRGAMIFTKIAVAD